MYKLFFSILGLTKFQLPLFGSLMKKIYLFIFILLAFQTNAQLLVSSPSFITETNTSTTITADASYGNKKLIGITSDIFVHIGVLTSISTSSADWKYVASTWGTSDAKIKCVALGIKKAG